MKEEHENIDDLIKKALTEEESEILVHNLMMLTTGITILTTPGDFGFRGKLHYDFS